MDCPYCQLGHVVLLGDAYYCEDCTEKVITVEAFVEGLNLAIITLDQKNTELREQLGECENALDFIAMGTEDSAPPFRSAPRDVLMNIAKKALKGINPQDKTLRADAENWRALMACQRFRVYGSGGLECDDGYGHIGMELWTLYNESTDTDQQSRDIFMKMIEKSKQNLKDQS